ncbi:ABZJ_00895 family protein [Fretibacter rubidus]|uniref:ABZJ_00895 family protein n=1 Tax=Fretibacter rubidus TaxID=570162 RepID=UPI00352ABD6C
MTGIDRVSLKPQYKIFTLVLVAATVLAAIIETILGVSLTGLKIIIPSLAAVTAGVDFLKTHDRRMTDAERKRAVRGSFAIFLLVSLITAPLGLIDPDNRDMIMSILAGFLIALLIVFALTYGLIALSYGWMVNKRAIRLGIVG